MLDYKTAFADFLKKYRAKGFDIKSNADGSVKPHKAAQAWTAHVRMLKARG